MDILEIAINQSERVIRKGWKCHVSQIVIGNWLTTARRRL